MSISFDTDSLLVKYGSISSSLDVKLKQFPVGFGDQNNTNFSTSNSAFTTGYTISPTLFSGNKDYIIFVSYTQRSTDSTETVSTRLLFNNIILPRSGFTNQSSVCVKSNGYYLGKITQPAIPVGIDIQISYGGIGNKAILDNIRWFAIELDSLDTNDYMYVENNVLTDISNATSTIASGSVNCNGTDEWLYFSCINAVENLGSPALINPNSTSGNGIRPIYNWNNTLTTTGSTTRFESIYENRSVSFLSYVDTTFASAGINTIYLQASKPNAIPSAVNATGAIFAVNMTAVNATHSQTGSSNSLITKTLSNDNLIWNVGWNSDDAEVISNGMSFGDPGNELPTGGGRSFNMDYRSDVFGPGTWDFEYNGIESDDKRHVVFVFAPVPVLEKRHSTSSLIQLISAIGNNVDVLLFQAFAIHNTDVLLFMPHIVYGTGLMSFNEISGNGNGIITRISDIIDPRCVNKRILDKYGWDPVVTQTRTFTKCNIKR